MNKTEPCINQTLNKVSMWSFFINLTCIFLAKADPMDVYYRQDSLYIIGLYCLISGDYCHNQNIMLHEFDGAVYIR